MKSTRFVNGDWRMILAEFQTPKSGGYAFFCIITDIYPIYRLIKALRKVLREGKMIIRLFF